MSDIIEILENIWNDSGFVGLFSDWRQLVMIVIACVLLYLGIVKKFEPLLLVGIAFGMLLTNLPSAGLYHPELWDEITNHTKGCLLYTSYALFPAYSYRPCYYLHRPDLELNGC